MEFLKNFINEYGTAILYALLTALAGYLGVWVKQLYTKYINDKTKQAVAKTVVQAVEQLYNNLNGEEKLEKALESASDMLTEKGINITDLELRMLIEAAVSEFNDAFHREKRNASESAVGGINAIDESIVETSTNNIIGINETNAKITPAFINTIDETIPSSISSINEIDYEAGNGNIGEIISNETEPNVSDFADDFDGAYESGLIAGTDQNNVAMNMSPNDNINK